MSLVRLKNGSTAEDVLVTMVMATLGQLMKESPILIQQLAKKCREPKHVFLLGIGKQLKEWSLLLGEDDVHDTVRDIVLSAVEGDGIFLRLKSPIME